MTVMKTLDHGLMLTCIIFTTASIFYDQLAQPIRLLLKYTGTEFENILYESAPGGSKSSIDLAD